MAVTLKQICRESGFSKATVSRVLNRHPLVSEETRRKVEAVIERYQFTPSAVARNLSLQKTDTVGVVFPWLSSGFFSTVLAGIDGAIRRAGYRMLTSLTHNEEGESEQALQLLQQRCIEGLLLMAPNLSGETLEKIKQHHLPVVLLQRELKDPQISSICVDNFDGARQATRHLIAQGRRRILAVAGPKGYPDSARREEGYRAALAEAGIEFESDLVIRSPDFSKETAVPYFENFRTQHAMPDGIFCFTDDMALGILKHLKGLGVRVPEQVAIIGFDGVEFTDFADLSTIQTPMLEMGEKAAELLIAQIQSKTKRPREHLLLKGTLVARGSTVAPSPSSHDRAAS
ncbi:MAG: LacI family DNA-binding transcriptional regulator [Verrucomicrobiae bacterium]|nr:LacI family DNA-binding transcriptional regulator [Verrucomicrobiae bacterium]